MSRPASGDVPEDHAYHQAGARVLEALAGEFFSDGNAGTDWCWATSLGPSSGQKVNISHCRAVLPMEASKEAPEFPR